MTDVHRFRMAMTKHLGKVMSSEMAAQIEAEAFAKPKQPRKRRRGCSSPLPADGRSAQDTGHGSPTTV